MAGLKVELSTTATDLPAGITFANIRLDLVDALGGKQSQTIDGVATLSTTFDNVPVGAGAVTASAIDSAGGVIGSPIQQAFTIVDTAPPPAQFPAPSGLVLTQV